MKLAIITLFALPLLVQGGDKYPRYSYATNDYISLSSTVLTNCFLLIADKYPNSRAKPSQLNYLGGFKGRHCDPEHDREKEWLHYLMGDRSRNCDFATGKESSLKEWILLQSDNSVDPLVLFEKSMELNEGNITLSLLTIHQLLRNSARWYNAQDYDYNSSPAEATRFWNKFIDIRGHLKDLGGNNEADHPGSWYRIWGMALWRVRKEYQPLFGENRKCSMVGELLMPERMLRNLQASTMAVLAEAVKPILVLKGNRHQLKDLSGKIAMNQLGAEIGAHFGSYISSGILNMSAESRKKMFEKVCQDKGFLRRSKK